MILNTHLNVNVMNFCFLEMFIFTEVPLESITLDTDRALVSEETSGTDVTFSSPSSGHLLTTANTRVILSQNNETHFSGETFRPSYSVSAHPSSTAQLVTISQGGISLGGDQSTNQGHESSSSLCGPPRPVTCGHN